MPQWKAHNVEEGVGYATLTDIIYQAWAGLTAREYKHLKGLRQENLRDSQSNSPEIYILFPVLLCLYIRYPNIFGSDCGLSLPYQSGLVCTLSL